MDVLRDDVLREVLRERRRRRQRTRRLRIAGVAAAAVSTAMLVGFVAHSIWKVPSIAVSMHGQAEVATGGLPQTAHPDPERSETAERRLRPESADPSTDSDTRVIAWLDGDPDASLPASGAIAEPWVDAWLGEVFPELASEPDAFTAGEAEPAPKDRSVLAAAAWDSEPAFEPQIEDVLERGDTLGRSLGRHGVGSADVARIARALEPHFDLRRARPGQRYRFQRDADGNILSFHYFASDVEGYELVASDEGFDARPTERRVMRQQARLAGVVSTSLYDAVQDLGERPGLASDFANIFAWEVDFARNVQPGDQFEILYERNFVPRLDGSGLRYLGPGRILAARYRGGARVHQAVYYEVAPGEGGYYRPDGTSVQQTFLAAPLKYTRISSSFSHARFHPILRVTRPHHGIDYAAPAGTPVWSVAAGRVTHVGWAGGFGRLVKVKHADGYESYYSHLSRFANGLRVGQRVSQKQVVGYVGQSGLATGPHTCFRITKNGRYVNPKSVQFPTGPPIPASEREDFETVSAARFGQLDAPSLASIDEAM